MIPRWKVRVAVIAALALSVITTGAILVGSAHASAFRPFFVQGNDYTWRHIGSGNYIAGFQGTGSDGAQLTILPITGGCSQSVCTTWTDLKNVSDLGVSYTVWQLKGNPGDCMQADTGPAQSVVQEECNTSALAQQWRAVSVSGGYQLYDRSDSQYIDAPGGQEGTQLVLSDATHATTFTTS